MNGEAFMSDYKYFSKKYKKKMGLTGKNKKKKKNLKKQEKALHYALDIRKFEIDLYWRRSAFFWAFIAAIYFAHFSLIKFFFDSNANEVWHILDKIKTVPILCRIALIATAALAFVFCHAWLLVNKASKFWQENWEAHVGKLENNSIGKLYDTFLNSTRKKDKSFSSSPLSYKPYDFSVSKITIIVSIAVSVLSFLYLLVLVFLSLNFSGKKHFYSLKIFSEECCCLCKETFFSILLILGFVLFVIGVCMMTVKAEGNKDRSENPKKYKSRWKQKKKQAF